MIVIQVILIVVFILVCLYSSALAAKLSTKAFAYQDNLKELFTVNTTIIILVVVIAATCIMISSILLQIKLDKVLSQLPA